MSLQTASNNSLVDDCPPIPLDKFTEQSGLSPVTIWRFRRAGMLTTVNICGRHYVTRAEIRRFNERAAAGEFAKSPARPKAKPRKESKDDLP